LRVHRVRGALLRRRRRSGSSSSSGRSSGSGGGAGAGGAAGRRARVVAAGDGAARDRASRAAARADRPLRGLRVGLDRPVQLQQRQARELRVAAGVACESKGLKPGYHFTYDQGLKPGAHKLRRTQLAQPHLVLQPPIHGLARAAAVAHAPAAAAAAELVPARLHAPTQRVRARVRPGREHVPRASVPVQEEAVLGRRGEVRRRVAVQVGNL
jgi:hypothetical protein